MSMRFLAQVCLLLALSVPVHAGEARLPRHPAPSPDGSLIAFSWQGDIWTVFADGGTSAVRNPSHTYAAAGTYTVALTVTDDGGATDATSQPVTVEPSTGITLTAIGYKVRGVRYVDLTWVGTSADVDIYLDSVLKTTTTNEGSYTDNLGRNSGTFVYQVCEAGTSNCSNEATVVF